MHQTICTMAPALVICLSSAVAANPMLGVTRAPVELHRAIAALPGAITLYDQSTGDTGVSIISTDFTEPFDSYDAFGADDFVVPKGHRWKIRQVEVPGWYHGAGGPASSENVFFYADDRGLPGALVAECSAIQGADNQGSFAIRLPKRCKVSLKGGKRYWISVVADVDFECCGYWSWETSNLQTGKPAAWENPNGGFGTTCTTWDAMTDCIGPYGEGPDFMFTLKGKDITYAARESI